MHLNSVKLDRLSDGLGAWLVEAWLYLYVYVQNQKNDKFC